MPRPRLSNHRVFISGNVVEVFSYTVAIGYNLLSSKKKPEYRGRSDDPKIHASAIARTRTNVIRTVNANSFQWKNAVNKVYVPQFVTFTFAENIQDIDYANSTYTNFIKRLNYHLYQTKTSVVKYLTVIEFQERGAVHYHTVFFNIPEIDITKEKQTREYADVWGQGFIEVKKVSDVKNVGTYIAKYMTKDTADRRLLGRRRFFCSKGLKRAICFSVHSVAEEMIKRLSVEIPLYHTHYKSAVTGLTYYAMYSIPDEDLQKYFGEYTLGS